MLEICSKNSETFDVWRTLAATGVKGYMNRVTYASQLMRPWGPLLPCTPHMLPSKYLSEMANQNLEKVNFWCVDEGALPLMTPINTYLGGNNAKKMDPLFNCQSIYARFGITSLELNMAPGVLLEPYMRQGGQGVAETRIVSKGLRMATVSTVLHSCIIDLPMWPLGSNVKLWWIG